MSAPDEKAAQDRLTELEIKAAFLEDLLDEVNRTVFRQQQQIEMLQQEIRALRQQMQSDVPDEQRTPADEVPPHY